MPVFTLHKDNISFPPADFAGPDGLIARGGKIDADWLWAGRTSGFFAFHHPMRSPEWWSPDPHFVLFPEKAAGESGSIAETGLNIHGRSAGEVWDFIQKKFNKEPMSPLWMTGWMKHALSELHDRGKCLTVSLRHPDGQIMAAATGIICNNCFFCEFLTGTSPETAAKLLGNLTGYLHENSIRLMDMHKPTCTVPGVKYAEILRSEYLSIISNDCI